MANKKKQTGVIAAIKRFLNMHNRTDDVREEITEKSQLLLKKLERIDSDLDNKVTAKIIKSNIAG